MKGILLICSRMLFQRAAASALLSATYQDYAANEQSNAEQA